MAGYTLLPKGRLKYYLRYFFRGWSSAVVPRKSFSESYISTIPNPSTNLAGIKGSEKYYVKFFLLVELH